MQNDVQRTTPPDELDGAKVIKWAWSGNEPFGLLSFQNGEHGPIKIFGLAICRYPGSDVVYRFSCDMHWEVHQDSTHESVDAAERELPEQYKAALPQWKPKTLLER